MQEAEKYSVKKTISKAAPPLVLIVLAEAVKATAKTQEIELSDDIVYKAAIAIYGGYLGLVNWIKNRKKGKQDEKAQKEK
jgi:hypothetical protein